MATSRARPVRSTGECACALLGAASTDIVTIDIRPANSIPDAGDRELVLNVAQVALSMHVGTDSAVEWSVEKDTEDDRIVNAMFKYPYKTCFTDQHIEAIKLVNKMRVRSVWVQPEDDCVYVGVSVWRSDVVAHFTVQDVVLVQRAVAVEDEPVGTKKRARNVR